MKKTTIALSLLCVSLLADPISIEKIIIQGGDSTTFIEGEADSFSKKSITTLGTHANINPYNVVQFSPSVHFSPTDLSGSNEPSFHDPIRIRSKAQSGPGGVYMLNSIPISSNPGGGKLLVDMENISSIDLLKGYLPTDKNLGFSSLIGKIDMQILAPRKEMQTTLSQSFGSDNFKKTFLRFDTGEMGDLKLFGSLSYVGSDKTKGSGDLTRTNFTLGASYTPSSDLRADLYFVHNSDEHHNYYSLSYADVKSGKYKKEFASTKPSANNDINYYDWNKQDFSTYAIFADVIYAPTSEDIISFKPYYKRDRGEYFFNKENPANSAMNRIINWRMDHDLFGVVASYEHTFSDAFVAKAGYSYHKQQPPGPPSQQRKYKSVNGALEFDGYAVLSKNDRHTIYSPFVELSGTLDRFSYSAGVQYQTFKLGSIDSYTLGTNATTSRDYDTAIKNGTLDPMASVDARSFHHFLPSLYASYELDSGTIYTDYTRSYGFDVNLYPTYTAQRANFVAKGVSLQELWDTTKLETSDNIDLGYKTVVGGIVLNPAVYVSFVQNKQAGIYSQNFGISYPANVGKALGYGAEFSANGEIMEDLDFLLSLSYNRYSFREDFAQAGGGVSNIKGNQLPDAPKVLAKTALSYTMGKLTITPSVRYTSSRYGDVANTQKISSYTIVDLDASYNIGKIFFANDASFRVSATNLTNEKYISSIITADNALAASTTSSTYQSGAPFGLYATLDLRF